MTVPSRHSSRIAKERVRYLNPHATASITIPFLGHLFNPADASYLQANAASKTTAPRYEAHQERQMTVMAEWDTRPRDKAHG